MLGIHLPLVLDFISEQKSISKMNQAKIDAAISLWHKAKSYPRKKKKAARIKANADYSFWKAIGNWHSEFTGF